MIGIVRRLLIHRADAGCDHAQTQAQKLARPADSSSSVRRRCKRHRTLSAASSPTGSPPASVSRSCREPPRRRQRIGTQAAARWRRWLYLLLCKRRGAGNGPLYVQIRCLHPMKDFVADLGIAEVTFTVLAHLGRYRSKKTLRSCSAMPRQIRTARDRTHRTRSAALSGHDRPLAQKLAVPKHFLRALYADDPRPAGRDRRPGAAHDPRLPGGKGQVASAARALR